MKEYQFNLHIYIEAISKEQAKEHLLIALDNLGEMNGHAPFGCDLEIANDHCVEFHTEEEDE